jgi:sugar lactone lactonase YvrE
MAGNPLEGFQVDRATIQHVGHDLQRPECILAEPDGTLWTADARGGVMRIDPDGKQELIRQAEPGPGGDDTDTKRYLTDGSLPNGITFAGNGDLIVANFGTDAIERMTHDGRSRTLFTEIDGQPLGKVNFAMTDLRGRIWITVTTRVRPWIRSINERTPDGYVAVMDDDGLRIVADGFVGTNEIRFDAGEAWLYVVESNARRISRIRIDDDGNEAEREIFGPDELPGTPDGCAFDSFGNLWVTLIHADRLIAITPEGEVLTLLDDGDAESSAAYDRHVAAGTVTPEIMGRTRGTLAPLMASITFGGPDLRTVYLGSILGTTLPSFRSPVAGLPLAHWTNRKFT